MAVTAAVVTCVANDWTLVASAVPKIAAFSARNPNNQCFLCPTTANTKPGGSSSLTANLPYIPFTGAANSVVNDDGSTYWWVWTATACDVVVWKV